MNDDAPKRIWATGTATTGSWNDVDVRYCPGTEYIRADHVQAELQAAVAAAYEDAARVAKTWIWRGWSGQDLARGSIQEGAYQTFEAIRARTDIDAQAALEAMLAKAREEREMFAWAMEEVAKARNEALVEAAAMIGVKVGHGNNPEDCQCGMCRARRKDHAAILALMEDQSDG